MTLNIITAEKTTTDNFNEDHKSFSDGLSEEQFEEIVRLACDENDAESQCVLGYCYENGIHVPEDKEMAFRMYQMAAFQGEPNGIYNVGVCLGFGIGTGMERNPQGWLENIKRAAEMGFAAAQNDYGWAFECAKDRGFFDVKDDARAFEWYLKSAKQGHLTGIENVIRCYEEGIGVEKNPYDAEVWRQRYRDAEHEEEEY